jgi:hypothetical protein
MQVLGLVGGVTLTLLIIVALAVIGLIALLRGRGDVWSSAPAEKATGPSPSDTALSAISQTMLVKRVLEDLGDRHLLVGTQAGEGWDGGVYDQSLPLGDLRHASLCGVSPIAGGGLEAGAERWSWCRTASL